MTNIVKDRAHLQMFQKPSSTVLVVDDYEPFRRFIRAVLEQRPEFQVVGQASDGLEAVQKAQELQPDLILLDIGLPKLSGIEVARRACKDAPNAKILFVSQESSSDVVKEALRFGTGYVLKAHSVTELFPAIELVLRGEHFLGTGLESSDGDHASAALQQRLSEITANLAGITKLPELLCEVLDAAIELSEADFGNFQSVNHKTGELKTIAHCGGLSPAYVEFFQTVQNGTFCCGTALKNRKRVIVEDVAADPIFCDSEARTIMLDADVRACQSTPLFSPSGELFGMLNILYRRSCRPPKSTLQLLDLVAERAGVLIAPFSCQLHDVSPVQACTGQLVSS